MSGEPLFFPSSSASSSGDGDNDGDGDGAVDSDVDGAVERLRALTTSVVDALGRWGRGPGPCSGISPQVLATLVEAIDVCPDEPVAFEDVLEDIGERVLRHGVRPSDPATVAHLHASTLLTAAATELAIGVTNQSMDSFDQAPAATLLEDHLVRWLAHRLGLPDGASGVLTAGGTASNLLGLLLARDHAVARSGKGTGAHESVAAGGLPTEARGWRIVASAEAHFSVQRAAAVLGLGHRAVVPVATDDHGRIDVAALDLVLVDLDRQGLRTVAVVGTAGTTDLGAIDPLAALADRADARRAWFHVDAAVGAGLGFSDRLLPRLAGLERADSITADLHKLGWQPIGASVLLVRDRSRFDVVRHPSDYLDRADDDPDESGMPNLVGRSLDTSRRFDALKVVVSLRSTGRRRMAAMVEHLVDTTAAVAALVEAAPDLELLAPASLVTVVFRWRPPGTALDDGTLDEVNTAIQRTLFAQGTAVVGRTRRHGRVALKLTLVNPATTVADVGEVLELVRTAGVDRAKTRPSGAPTGSPTDQTVEEEGARA